jgi:hypothetical protein
MKQHSKRERQTGAWRYLLPLHIKPISSITIRSIMMPNGKSPLVVIQVA